MTALFNLSSAPLLLFHREGWMVWWSLLWDSVMSVGFHDGEPTSTSTSPSPSPWPQLCLPTSFLAEALTREGRSGGVFSLGSRRRPYLASHHQKQRDNKKKTK